MRFRWYAVILGSFALLGGLAFLWPLNSLPELANPPTISATKPGKERSVQVQGGQLVLPPVAGTPAAVQFKVINIGKNTVFLTGVAIENTTRSAIFETVGPDMRPLTNVALHPGDSVNFGLGSTRVVLSEYGEDVLPGRRLRMTLRFADNTTSSFPLTVTSAIGEDGEVDMPITRP